MSNPIIESALQETKAIVDYFTSDEIDFQNLSTEERRSIKHLIESIRCGCECDSYNGYDCGCSRRSGIYQQAMKEFKANE